MEKIKKLRITGSEIVVQDNNLIDSPRLLTLQEQRLFLFLVSKLDPSKEDDITFRIPVGEFAKAIGANSGTDVYRDLIKISKQLMSRVISIKKETSIAYMHIISYAEYWPKSGCIDLKISPEIAPYLFELKKEYTTYKLSQVTSLSSIYAIRIYEMLKKHERIGNRTFFIDELRQKLAIPSKQYLRFNSFKLKVLDIAKREINDKTDLLIDFDFVKSGRKITAVQFRISAKNPTKREANMHAINSEKEKQEHLQKVIDFGFSKKIAFHVTQDLSEDEIGNAISAIKEQIKRGKVKNPQAMLKTALKGKWKTNNTKPPKNEKNAISEESKTTGTKISFKRIFDYFFRR
jgi:plasmid replication initiation protein